MFKQTRLALSLFACLIVFASFSAGDVTSMVNAQRKSAQAKPVPKSIEANQDVQAQKVINDSVLEVKGMLFPKVAPPPNAKVNASCCQPYETRSVNGVAKIDIESPHNYSKNKDYPTDGPIQVIYSPPMSCWVISSYYRGISSANSPYYAYDDAQPANFHYVTSSEYVSVFEEMKTYVGSLNIPNKFKADFNLKLQQFVYNYGMYTNSIRTGKEGQLRHTARLKGRGWPNGRSWYHGYVNVTEICCPPEVRDPGELKKTLKAWIDQTASKLNGVINVKGDPRSTN